MILTRGDIQALPTSAAFAALTDIVERLTKRRVEARRLPRYLNEYAAFEGYISIPHNDVEGLLHELCHWVIATPRRRRLHDYGLNLNQRRAIQEEICCGWLEQDIYEQAGIPMPTSSVHEQRYWAFSHRQSMARSRWRRYVNLDDQTATIKALRLPGGDIALWDKATYDEHHRSRRIT